MRNCISVLHSSCDKEVWDTALSPSLSLSHRPRGYPGTHCLPLRLDQGQSTMGPVRDFGGISSIGYRTIASLFLSSDALLLWLVILCGEGLRVRRYAQLTPTPAALRARPEALTNARCYAEACAAYDHNSRHDGLHSSRGCLISTNSKPCLFAKSTRRPRNRRGHCISDSGTIAASHSWIGCSPSKMPCKLVPQRPNAASWNQRKPPYLVRGRIRPPMDAAARRMLRLRTN